MNKSLEKLMNTVINQKVVFFGIKEGIVIKIVIHTCTFDGVLEVH